MGVPSRRDAGFHSAGKANGERVHRSINGNLRDECLNANQFLSIVDAKSKIEAWRVEYNVHRPHSSLGQLSPKEYLQRAASEDEKTLFSSFERA